MIEYPIFWYPNLGYSKVEFPWKAVHFLGFPALASTQPDLYKALLQALIQARKDAGVTQVELAARIGRRQTFVSKFETEERRLDVAEYIAIARALDAELHRLMQAAEWSPSSKR